MENSKNPFFSNHCWRHTSNNHYNLNVLLDHFLAPIADKNVVNVNLQVTSQWEIDCISGQVPESVQEQQFQWPHAQIGRSKPQPFDAINAPVIKDATGMRVFVQKCLVRLKNMGNKY